mmetsp:Transcript_121295/g.377561  ORF Transcript_121295/g.377561 Transcript_121295/m.377561 type:complete len:215 (-) Transcript_121295:101-745(-)
MAVVEKATTPAAAVREGGLLLGTGVAGSVRSPSGQPLMVAEPRYSHAAFAPPAGEVLGSLGGGDITTWYPGGGAAAKAALLRQARLALDARTPPTTPHRSLPASPVPTPPATPVRRPAELGMWRRPGPLPTLLASPPSERQPAKLCLKRGVRPPPGLTGLAEEDEASFPPPPGLSLVHGADCRDDPKGDADTCSTVASSRTASASVIVSLAESP